MTEKYKTAKYVTNAKRLVYDYLRVSKRLKELEYEKRKLKERMELDYAIEIPEDEKVLFIGNKKDIELGTCILKREVIDPERCLSYLINKKNFQLYRKIYLSAITFCIPELERILSAEQFESVIETSYGERVVRIKNKKDIYPPLTNQEQLSDEDFNY